MFPSKFVNSALVSGISDLSANLMHGYSENHAGFQINLPAVNIEEDADAYKISLAAPGLDKSGFELQLNNDLLTVCYKNESEKAYNNKPIVRREFYYSNFKRAFSLPKTAETDTISANYQDGILYISIPKKEEAKPKPARQIALA